jgi:hypothetical protein
MFLGISPEVPDLLPTVSAAQSHFKGGIEALVSPLRCEHRIEGFFSIFKAA